MKNKVNYLSMLLFAAFCFATNAQPGANDPTFNPTDLGFGNGDGANGDVNAFIQSDGKIIIAGYFTYNGTGNKCIARLNADGTLDGTFNSGGPNGQLRTVAFQSDGKIIICGIFTSIFGIPRNYIARLNADGSLDETFDPGTGLNGEVWTVGMQSDGKIIIGGWFTSYNGTAVNRIARLNTNGSLDGTFNTSPGATDLVSTCAIQSDGKIIIGGDFTWYNGTARNYIARINTDGSLDGTFNPGTGANDDIRTVAIQSDGKVIIGGYFTSYNGTVRNSIARLNTDGSLDGTFNPGTGANDFIWISDIQSDGKIIIGGNFTSYNGTAINRIARLNADGSLDGIFNPGTGANDLVRRTNIQSDGKIIISGDFTAFIGTSRNAIVRLNANGSFDATFNSGTGANNAVYTSSLQSDGKIIIGGIFTSFNGTSINRIDRLINGLHDPTFNAVGEGANAYVMATNLQSDGKIIIGGYFTSYNGTATNYIARLNDNGSLDGTFNPGTGANDYVRTTAIQSDGKIIIGGNFTSYNGTGISRVARLNTNGSLDGTFNPGTGADNWVRTIAIQSDGKIIIGGEFISYNGTAISRIARINSDGSLDGTFNTGTGVALIVNTSAIQSDGKIIIGGGFTSYNGTAINRIARLNTNGSLDGTFNVGTGANDVVRTIAIQSDGKIIIGGSFTNYNGTVRNRIARLNTDGSLDETFNPGTGTNDWVLTTAIQSDGDIIIGGFFTGYNGTGRNRVARIIGGSVPTSVLRTSEEKITSVYPNPFSSELTLEIRGNNEKINFEVLNSIGQVIFKGNFVEKTTVQTSSFKPGFYLIKFENGKFFEIRKIIKK